MGVIAMMAATFGFWRLASQRAAFMFVAVLALGILSYWTDPDQKSCDNRTWFCSIVPYREPAPKPIEPCPTEEPISTPIFQSDAANAEVQRLIQLGVCQKTAIDRVAHGWKAPFDPAYR